MSILPTSLPKDVITAFSPVLGDDPKAIARWLSEYESGSAELSEAEQLLLARDRIVAWLDAKERDDILAGGRIFLLTQIDCKEHLLLSFRY